MPLFLLIRHGENDYVRTGRLAGRLPEVHLNEKGRAQANLLAEKLASAPVKAVYSSPLERALETAAPIAAAINLPVIENAGLIEMDYGEWQNQKLKGLSRLKIWKLVQAAPSVMRFPSGERFAEAQMRIANTLLDILSCFEPKDVIICVSHADPIKLAVAYFIGLPLDMFQRLSVSPASITILALGESGGRLVALNAQADFDFEP